MMRGEKTILVIASCDSKREEALFMRRTLLEMGVKPLLADIAIGPDFESVADIRREEILEQAGFVWRDVCGRSKGELIELMMEAMKAAAVRLYREGKIDGVLSVGGVQNSTIAACAMRALPVGVPKVLGSTVASGKREFADVVGESDIVVIPSISDFAGVNMITQTIMRNACACAAGMARWAGTPLQKGKRPVVGVTLMGVTTRGATAAIRRLEELGIEAIGFHSTGTGGVVMETLAQQGLLDGILDLTTHEVASEYFKKGYSYCGGERLHYTDGREFPVIVCTGGLDFVDFYAQDLPDRMEERKYNMHNDRLAHVKLLPDEAARVGAFFAQKLNRLPFGVEVYMPTQGMRANTEPGGSMDMPETDAALLRAIQNTLDPQKVTLHRMQGNLDTAEWGIRIADIMAARIGSVYRKEEV